MDSGSDCSLVRKNIADALTGTRDFIFTRLTGIGSNTTFSFSRISSLIKVNDIHVEVTLVIVDSHILPHDVIIVRYVQSA